VILAVLAAFLSPPGTIDVSDVRNVHGFNPSPDCAEWMKARRSHRPRSNPHEAWVMGVLTGYNLYHPNGHHDILEGTTLSAAFAWIDRRCAANPDAALPDVTLDLVGELKRHWPPAP
jgi:hypothetical protein